MKQTLLRTGKEKVSGRQGWLLGWGGKAHSHCTLRARAETSWCQSRNFVYLGLKT